MPMATKQLSCSELSPDVQEPTPHAPKRPCKAQRFHRRKDNLLACLNRKEKISDEDEEWLDNVGNLVDEEAVVDLLENVYDYEHGLTQLTSQQKSLVEKLKELGGKVKKAVLPGNKRKSITSHLPASCRAF